MASEYKLRLLYRAEFHDIYAEHSEHPEFGPLLQRMKVVDAQGESQMDEDQWEAASKFVLILIAVNVTEVARKMSILALHLRSSNLLCFAFLFFGHSGPWSCFSPNLKSINICHAFGGLSFVCYHDMHLFP